MGVKWVLAFWADAWRDGSGVAALEFALVAPILITFIAGTVEISNAIRLQAKLEVTAGQLAEFIAGQSSVTAPQWMAKAPPGSLADLCNGAAMNLFPYPTGTLSADIVSLSNDYTSNRPSPPPNSTSITVNTYADWENISSCVTKPPNMASPLGLNGAFLLANSPASLLSKTGTSAANKGDSDNLKYGYSAIVVKVQYNYENVLKFLLDQTISFSAVAVVRPRSNTTIRCTVDGSTSCPVSP